MAEPNSTLAASLERIAAELLSIAKKLKPAAKTTVAVKPPNPVRLKKGQCLQCPEPPNDAVSGRRGLCEAHYQQTRRRLKKSPELEEDLIRNGLLLEASPGGRKEGATESLLTQFLNDPPGQKGGQNRPK
jgi:hypothetical protein